MKVSVIIPAYNAELFLRTAVVSALDQEETAEVVIVDDGSQDNTMGVAKSLEMQDARVFAYTHSSTSHRGISATRNVGIRHASCPFIAFLDADDNYLPGRFGMTKQVFKEYPDTDGVFEKIGARYTTPSLCEKHLERTGSKVTGLNPATAPDHVFRVLARGDQGHIHLNGLVIRREVLDEGLRFDETLDMAEDTAFILHLAVTHVLRPGNPDQIIAERRVHLASQVFNDVKYLENRRRFVDRFVELDFYGSRDRMAIIHLIAKRFMDDPGYLRFQRFPLMRRLVMTIKLGGYFGERTRVLWRVLNPSFRAKRD